MITTTRARLELHIQTWAVVKIGLLLVAVGGVLYILTQSYPIGMDWHFTFGRLWAHLWLSANLGGCYKFTALALRGRPRS